MAETILVIACQTAAVICAALGGIFLAFSDFIMRSLGKAEPIAVVECMQTINREIYRSIFMVLFMGMAPVSILLAAAAWFVMPGAEFYWSLGGAVSYVFGVLLLTGMRNVPMNQKLDAMDRADEQTHAYWQHYCLVWTRWNHIRTVFCFISAGCYLMVG